MIRPAWGASVVLHAGVMALLYLLAWASPPVQPPVNWVVRLAVEPEPSPGPAVAAPAAAMIPRPETTPATPATIPVPPKTPAAPPSLTAPPVTPAKSTPPLVARQAPESPPVQRRPKTPSAPAVRPETPRKAAKSDPDFPMMAKPSSPEQQSGEEPAAASHPGPAASPPYHAEAVTALAREPDATSGLGRGASGKQLWYAALILKLREMRRYPPAARRLGQEGVVLLAIEIGMNGELRSATLRKSSGFALLDQAATHLIQEAVAALDGQLSPPSEGRLEIPVAYRLDN